MQGDHVSQAKLKMVPKASKTKQKKSNFIKTRKFLSVPGATEGVKEEQTFRKADRKSGLKWAVLTLMVRHQQSLLWSAQEEGFS